MKIAIVGMGRVGRALLKALLLYTSKGTTLEPILLADEYITPAQLVYLMKYDSVHYNDEFIRTYQDTISYQDYTEEAVRFLVANKEIRFYNLSAVGSINSLPLAEIGVDVAIDCRGVSFKGTEYIAAGAKMVLSAGIYDQEFSGVWVPFVNDNILSSVKHGSNIANPSMCAAAYVLRVLHDNFGVQSALINNVESYTGMQQITDFGSKNLVDGRAAANNISPDATGPAFKSLGTSIIPLLAGKVLGATTRVPCVAGGMCTITAALKKEASVEQIAAGLKSAMVEGSLGLLKLVTNDPIVTTDVLGRGEIFISNKNGIMVCPSDSGGSLVAINALYDNETTFAANIIAALEKVSQVK